MLAHPELELVALGSDSLAGSPASVLDPRLNGSLPAFVDERGGARSRGGARLLLPRARASGGARRPCRRRRRRPLGRASADGRLALSRLVRLRASERRLARRLELRDPGALPAGGVADREPRLLRHRRPARARAARRRDRADRSRRRRQVGRLGRGAHAEGVVARDLGARERLAVQGRVAPARARDRAGARLPRLLRPAPAAGEARAARHLLRDRDRRPARCARGGVRRLARRDGAGGRRSRPSSRASRAPTEPRSASSPTARPAPGSSSARSTTSARAPRARRCRTRTSRWACPRRPACGSPECSCERHRREGVRRRGRARGHPPQGARPRRRPLDRARRRNGDVHRQPGTRGAGRRLEAASRGGRAAGDRDQLRRRECGHRRARRAGCPRDRGGGRAAARPLRRGGARPLDRRDRRAAAAREGARRPARRGAGARRRPAAQAPRRRSSPPTRRRRRPRSRSTGSPSAGWRRAPG